MKNKILILSVLFYIAACTEKQNLGKNQTKGSSVLLEKIIKDIQSKSESTHYKLPAYETLTLDNKLQIIFMKDDLPYVHFKMRLNAGRRFENKEGLSEAVASLLDRGTTSLTREEILNTLDKMGASFSASAGQEFSWLQASGLAKNEKILMNLFWELLTKAKFVDSEWTKEKQVVLAELESLPNKPDSFLDKIFDDFIHKDTPYKGESRSSVNSLARLDLVKFYNQHYQPSKASLLVLGQYTEELKKNIIQKFSNWKPKVEVQSVVLQTKTIFNSPITLVHKSDSVQANIIIGMPVDLISGHPDTLAAKLANFSLGGGGFNARLMERVRQKEGLTYGIYSYFSALKNLGTFQVSSSTNQGSLGRLLEVTLEEITNFYKNGVSQAELDFAKLYYSNSLFRSLEKKETLMGSFLSLSGMGRDPVSYFENFSDRVQAIDLVTVNKMVKKYFNPKKMKIFILAKKDSQGGESNPKNKGKYTVVEQLDNFSKKFPVYKGLDIKNYQSISY